MVQEQGTHVEGCSSEGTEGILFYAGFKVVHIAVGVRLATLMNTP